MLKSTETKTSVSTVVIGNLIYEESGKITGTRVINVEEPKVEFTYTAKGILRDEIDVTNTGTYWVVPKSSGMMYGEARGVFFIKGGGEIATWTAQGVGRYSAEENRKMTAIGSVFFKTSSTSRLAFLNDIVAVFKHEEDQAGNVYGKKFELK
jgi:hypothetical protein